MKGRKFRLSLKAIAWECSIIFLAITFLVIASIIGGVALKITGSSEISTLRLVFLVVFGLPILAIVVFSIVLILVSIGRAIFSYLLLSDDGLEYSLWPSHKIRCTWDDVEQISKSPSPFQGDVLTLKKADVTGFHIVLDFNKGNFGITKTLHAIPLYRIEGWLNGELKYEIRKYAPHLF